MTIRLLDAQEQHLKHPDTFDVPQIDWVWEAAKPGATLKICFLWDPEDVPDDDIEGFLGERVWVKVTRIEEFLDEDMGIIHGTLSNQPLCIPGIQADDPVAFRPENVLDIWDDWHEKRYGAAAHASN